MADPNIVTLVSGIQFSGAQIQINTLWTSDIPVITTDVPPVDLGQQGASVFFIAVPVSTADYNTKVAEGQTAWFAARGVTIGTTVQQSPVSPPFRRVVATPDALDPMMDYQLSVDTSTIGMLVSVDLPDVTGVPQGTPYQIKSEDGDFDIGLVPFGTDQIDEMPGTFLLSSVAPLPARVCVTIVADQVTLEAPATPAAPAPFVGTVRAVPGTYATVAAAIAAAVAGDIIEVAAASLITEAGTVNIDKSLEIRGVDRATSVVEGPAVLTAALFNILTGVNGVYIHTLTIRNNQTPATDGGGLSSCISAPTQRAATPLGSTGLYIADCNIVHPKQGIAIDANGWVIRDCAFTCVVAAAATTVRSIVDYGTANTCFIDTCTFTCTADVTPRTQMMNIYSTGPRDISFFTGQSGALIVRNCVQVGTCRGYIEQNYWKQPGDSADPVTPGGFSLYVEGCTFGAWSAFPVSFFNTVGAGIDPLDFYSVLWLSDSVTGSRTAGDQKGFVAFDGDGGPGRSIGTLASGLYTPVANVLGSALPSAAYFNGSMVDDLLGVKTSIFDLSIPLISPSAASMGMWRLGPSFG